MKTTHIGFCLDESGSIKWVKNSLIDAYNKNILFITESIIREKQAATVTAYAFGDIKYKHRLLYEAQQIQTILPLSYNSLKPSGMTPLFDSIYKTIKSLSVLDDGDPDTSFIITAITDGAENASTEFGVLETLKLMNEKISTDRWTFTFLVPKRMINIFASSYNIPKGNILGWENTEKEVSKAFDTTMNSYDKYFIKKNIGMNSTFSFFTTDLTDISNQTISQNLIDISNEVQIYTLSKEYTPVTFFNNYLKNTYIKGSLFYQLMKTEKNIQSYKIIIIRDKSTGIVYSGKNARYLLNLPEVGDIKVIPGNHSIYDIFIQTTSINRKLLLGSSVLVWKNFRKL